MLTAAFGFAAGANGAAEQLDGLHLGSRGASAAGAHAAGQEQPQQDVNGGGQAAAPLPAADAPPADGQQEAAAPAVSPAEMDAQLQVRLLLRQQQDASQSPV